MSPRLRWPGGRRGAERAEAPTASTRSPAAGTLASPVGTAPSPAGATTSEGEPEQALSDAGEHVVERIWAAATGGRDGVLQVVGDPGGLVYLGGGRVLLVQTRTAPGVDVLVLHRGRDHQRRLDLLTAVATSEGRDTVAAQARRLLVTGGVPPMELDVLQQQAVADAAYTLLAVDGTRFVRSRFFRGERPWTRVSDPVPVDDLIAEATRRRRLAARVAPGVRPGSRPVRGRHLPVPSVRLAPLQWDLVVHADGARTTTDLAWLLGRGVFATTMEVSRLKRVGLLDLADEEPEDPDAAPDQVSQASATAGHGDRDGGTYLVPARGGLRG